jgi:hypothetical protein
MQNRPKIETLKSELLELFDEYDKAHREMLGVAARMRSLQLDIKARLVELEFVGFEK